MSSQQHISPSNAFDRYMPIVRSAITDRTDADGLAAMFALEACLSLLCENMRQYACDHAQQPRFIANIRARFPGAAPEFTQNAEVTVAKLAALPLRRPKLREDILTIMRSLQDQRRLYHQLAEFKRLSYRAQLFDNGARAALRILKSYWDQINGCVVLYLTQQITPLMSYFQIGSAR